MTVNAIIEQLYKSPDLDDCIKKMVRTDHQEDFKHEIILLLYEKPHELILNLYNTSGLTYYVVRIVLNLVNQKRNVYHRMYNDYNITYDTSQIERKENESTNLEERLNAEERELELIDKIKNFDDPAKFPFYKALVEQVQLHGGMRAASRATGIDVSVISRRIKKIRDHLNQVYNGEPIKGVY